MESFQTQNPSIIYMRAGNRHVQLVLKTARRAHRNSGFTYSCLLPVLVDHSRSFTASISSSEEETKKNNNKECGRQIAF
jgi:hypothetical protein